MKRYSKKEIVDAIMHHNIGLPAYQVKAVINAFISEMQTHLSNGNSVEIRGFGVLSTKVRAARTNARNPRTGEVITIPARRVVVFRPSKVLKEAVHHPPTKDNA